MESYSQFSTNAHICATVESAYLFLQNYLCSQIICYMPDSQGFLEIAEVLLYHSDPTNRNYLHFCFVVGVISHVVLNE